MVQKHIAASEIPAFEAGGGRYSIKLANVSGTARGSLPTRLLSRSSHYNPICVADVRRASQVSSHLQNGRSVASAH